MSLKKEKSNTFEIMNMKNNDMKKIEVRKVL
jgi:hypothetical protein